MGSMKPGSGFLLVAPIQELFHILRCEPGRAENLFRARAGKVLRARLENELVLMLPLQGLLLQQAPATLIHKEPDRMIERFEEILAPSAVSRMPETGHHDATGSCIVIGVNAAGHYHDQVAMWRRAGGQLGGRQGDRRWFARRIDDWAGAAGKLVGIGHDQA
jgi:hypothetical protein